MEIECVRDSVEPRGDRFRVCGRRNAKKKNAPPTLVKTVITHIKLATTIRPGANGRGIVGPHEAKRVVACDMQYGAMLITGRLDSCWLSHSTTTLTMAESPPPLQGGEPITLGSQGPTPVQLDPKWCANLRAVTANLRLLLTCDPASTLRSKSFLNH